MFEFIKRNDFNQPIYKNLEGIYTSRKCLRVCFVHYFKEFHYFKVHYIKVSLYNQPIIQKPWRNLCIKKMLKSVLLISMKMDPLFAAYFSGSIKED